MTELSSDVAFMARAIKLARQGWYTTRPNPRVGCVIVKDNVIIGEGYHARAGEAHAEIHALSAAGEQAEGACAYVTLEPCAHVGKTPPCANALIEAGLKRVVVAMQDPNPLVGGQGIERMREAGIEVVVNVLAGEAARLNPGFIKRMQTGMPYVRVKLAMSLDGRTAMASGESKWITCANSRADVHRLRAASGAVLTGSGTVLADDPSLTFRIEDFDRLVDEIPADTVQPLRVVCDSRLRTPTDARLLRQPGQTLIATLRQATGQEDLQQAGAEILYVSDNDGKLSLQDLLEHLARHEINDVMVEAGASLAGALLDEQLVDEFVIYMAPHLMGSQARGLVNLAGLSSMDQRLQLSITDIRSIGDDWRITAQPLYS